MEIHEPFSDLEKQISNILDQLDKQEPLSTAACKQVVAGLEKIKEYQINPSEINTTQRTSRNPRHLYRPALGRSHDHLQQR